tara:strand:+ start:1679 stop:2062 length:384 start_codon:yes stop_codon:yes gene_type:complete
MQKMKDNYDINDPANSDLIISESMDNMYKVITKKETYDSLSKKKGRVLMTFNPLDDQPNIDEIIDDLINYYSSEDVEEYEKCAELVRIKDTDPVMDPIMEYFEFDYERDDGPDIDFEADWDVEDNDR